MEEDFVCAPVRDKHGFVFGLYPLYFFFVCFVTILCKIIHLPKLGTRVRLIWGDEAFTETNFTPIFLLIMYDMYYEATVSSLIKPSYTCVLKSFATFSQV